MPTKAGVLIGYSVDYQPPSPQFFNHTSPLLGWMGHFWGPGRVPSRTSVFRGREVCRWI
jgi:hypothetical protein